MASTQKLQSTADGDMWKYYPATEVSDFYVSSMNTVKPTEKAQSGSDVKFSIPINLGSSTTLNIPLGNFNFIGNMMLRVTGSRGKNHSPMHVMLPGCKANQKSDPDASYNYKYKTPTGNFLPMNGYDLIDEVQIMLPGDEYYTLKGEDMFTFLMSQCESEEKREILYEASRIEPCVDEAKCDSFPSVLLYGGNGNTTAGVAANTELLGAVPGRQELITAKSRPFECVLLLAFPWCSPNKDRRPKPLPTYKFGTQQATMNITWKNASHLNMAVASNANFQDGEMDKLVVSTCDLHFEYFNFANKAQLTSIDQYTYPSPSIYPVELKQGSLKVISGQPGATAAAAVSDVKYSCILNGLRQGETSHLIVTFMSSLGECMLPINMKLDIGGQTIYKAVDTEGKLGLLLNVPYDDVGNKFFDKRFEFMADATKYQGGNNTSLTIVSNQATGALPNLPAAGQAVTGLLAKVNLEKKAIPGIPVACWTLIPFGKGTCSTNYHNYALGTRLDTSDVELTFTIPKYYDPTDSDYPYKSPDITEVRIIQVMNSFWQFNGDKVKLFR